MKAGVVNRVLGAIAALIGPEDLKQFAPTPEAARALASDLNEMAQICSGEWRV